MAIVRSAIRNLLVPGIRTVFWDYESYPSQYKEIYKTRDSKMAEEKEIEMRMFGLAQFKSEAGPIAFDNGFGQPSGDGDICLLLSEVTSFFSSFPKTSCIILSKGVDK